MRKKNDKDKTFKKEQKKENKEYYQSVKKCRKMKEKTEKERKKKGKCYLPIDKKRFKMLQYLEKEYPEEWLEFKNTKGGMSGNSFHNATRLEGSWLYDWNPWPNRRSSPLKGGARKTLRLDRKGPSESATLFPKGTKRVGNDGNMWIITVTKKGVHRWSKDNKVSKVKMTKGKKYLIHDNGGRPFLVNINGKDVSIFKLPKGVEEDKDTSKSEYTELVKEYKGVKKVFIGKSVKPKDDTAYYAAWGKEFDGNTILIEIQDKRYCLVAERIVEFSTKDSIEKFESPVGNNDVPYPLAYGSQYVYVFGFDEHKYIPRDTVKGLSTGKIQEKYAGECCPWKSELDKFKKNACK